MKLHFKPQLLGIILSTFAMSTNGVAQLYDFEEHTFTNASAEGKDGPSLSDCQVAYAAETWELDPALFNMTTNGIQEWTVPTTGDYLIEAAGAQGGDHLYTVDPEDGGLGAVMAGRFSLVEGQILYLIVGQQGVNSAEGGDFGYDNAAPGGGGGSFVWDPTDPDGLPLIAAGGGGGGTSPGNFDGRNANTTIDGNEGLGRGNGGTDGNGGGLNTGGGSYWAGGGCGWLTNGTAGNVPTLYEATPLEFSSAGGGLRPAEGGVGGERWIDGGDVEDGNEGGDGGFGGGGGGGSDNMGSGGGGGYSGGGGNNGSAQSGGGGGSYNSGLDQENVVGNSGHGYITIMLLCDPITVEAVETEFCEGEELVLNGTAETGLDVTWDMGVENGVAFAPPVGTTTYTGSTISTEDCHFQIEITVNALPEVFAVADLTEVCEGEIVTLTGDGATTYSWDPTADDGVAFAPAVGTTTYTVTGTDDNGCENTASIDITANALPEVEATADSEIICIGSDIVLSGTGATTYVWDPVVITDGEPYTMDELGFHTFTVTGTDDNGCESEAEITVEVYALPTVDTYLEDEVICLGSSTYFAGSGAFTYEWDMGVIDGEAFTPDAVGTETYTVIGTDVFGCQNTASVDLEVTENTLEMTSVIMPETVGDDGEIDITITGGMPDYTFDWDNDGTGDFDDTEDLTGLAEGTYTVHIIDDEGCELIEELVLVDQAGITSFETDMIAVYPNPTTDFITVTFEGEFNYTLFTMNGAMLLNGVAVDSEYISMGTLSNGEYLLQIVSNGQSQILKIIKQ